MKAFSSLRIAFVFMMLTNLLLFMLPACDSKKSTNSNATIEEINKVENNDILAQSTTNKHIDSVWFADYVTVPQRNPDPEYLNPQNPEFIDYEKYERERINRPSVQKFSDTVVGNFGIRAYLIKDTMELAHSDPHKGGPDYCFNIYKAVMVIDDHRQNRTDSIIIFRKLVEDFFNGSLYDTQILGFDFHEVRNDTLVFEGAWFKPDSDVGVIMEFKFYNRKLTLSELILQWGDDDLYEEISQEFVTEQDSI